MKHTADSNAPSMQPRRSATIWSRLLRYGVPPVITIGLCYLLFTGVDMHEMARIIRTECRFGYIALALVISIFSHVFRAMRWRIQLNALGIRTPLGIIILSIFGTYAVNLVLPRLGELWRTGYIASRQRAPFSTVFGSMICDRLSDTITVFLLTLLAFVVAQPQIVSYLQQNPDTYTRLMAVIASPALWITVTAVALLCIALCHRFPHSRIVTALRSLLSSIWQGFAVVGRMEGKVLWLLYTALIWGCYFTQLYVCFYAFPLTADVAGEFGPTAVLVCFVLSSLSMAVPSNGGIGPYQWALMFGLSMYASGVPGLTREYALSFGNTVMGCQTLLLILLGILTFVLISIDRHHNKPTGDDQCHVPAKSTDNVSD